MQTGEAPGVPVVEVQDLHMPDGAGATHTRREILVSLRTGGAGYLLFVVVAVAV